MSYSPILPFWEFKTVEVAEDEESIYELFDSLRPDGWDLILMAPLTWAITGNSAEVTTWRCVFKRRLV